MLLQQLEQLKEDDETGPGSLTETLSAMISLGCEDLCGRDLPMKKPKMFKPL